MLTKKATVYSSDQGNLAWLKELRQSRDTYIGMRCPPTGLMHGTFWSYNPSLVLFFFFFLALTESDNVLHNTERYV